jgi:polyhydroxybutyrate depolymerase
VTVFRPIVLLFATVLGASQGAQCAERAQAPDCLDVRGRLAGPLATACRAIEHGGRQRTYRLYLPAKRVERAPLLFVLHGGGGSGASLERLTRGEFHAIAERDGVIVLYPDGVDRHWNDGRPLPETAARESVDDVGFLRALVETIATERAIDRTRIYAIGISNGGFMSLRLACEAAETFAAVAPVTAALSTAIGPTCRPARAISIAIVNGTEDPLVPWAGGTVSALGLSNRGEAWSTERTFRHFLAADSCAGSTLSSATDVDPADETTLVIHSGTGCREGVEVLLYELRGGGHTWPRGEVYAHKALVGRVSNEVDATQEIWRFFARHARER